MKSISAPFGSSGSGDFSGSYTDPTSSFTVTWSYVSSTGVWDYTISIIKDYTVTINGSDSFTFKVGGSEHFRGSFTATDFSYTDTASFPYVYHSASHTIGWSIQSTETFATSTYSLSGTITYDGTAYPFSESGKY
jgi:hypothetical protein